MAQYRTLEPVVYVDNGVVVSVDALRVVDLTDEQAEGLAGKVSAPLDNGATMFPEGSPNFDHVIVRHAPVVAFAPEPAAPAPAEEPAKAEPKKAK